MSQARAQGALAAVGLPGLLCAILTAGLLLWSWRYASHSFDFTDESFYLIWMSAPFRYDWSVSQFGFIYHPLYQVLDGDIASLRRANLLFVFVLAWAVSDRYLRLLGAQQSELGWPRALLAAALATSALMVFSAGLITPNYNTLTLQGLLIALLGLMGLQLPATPRSLPPWLLLGGGGWLVFLAKPSSALALAVLALGYLLMWGRRDVRAAGLSALTAALLLLASALVIDGSLSGFVARLRTGVDIASLILDQDALTHIFRFDFPARSAFDQRLCLSLIAVTALAVMSVWAQGRARKILLLATLLALLDCAWWLWHLPRLSWASLRHFAGFFCMLGVAFGALLGGLLTQRQALLRSTTRVHLATGLLCAALPYVYAFGTYSNYSQAATKASFFWMLAGLTCLHPVANQVRQWRVLVPVAVMAALVSAVFITRDGAAVSPGAGAVAQRSSGGHRGPCVPAGGERGGGGLCWRRIGRCPAGRVRRRHAGNRSQRTLARSGVCAQGHGAGCALVAGRIPRQPAARAGRIRPLQLRKSGEGLGARRTGWTSHDFCRRVKQLRRSVGSRLP